MIPEEIRQEVKWTPYPERKIGGQECGIIRCGWTLEHVDTEFKMSISGFRGSLKTKEFLWTVFELYLQEAKFI